MIVMELMGGLGNQMFQYAIGRYLSHKWKTDLVMDTYFLLHRDTPPDPNIVYRDYDLGIFNIQEKFAEKRISKNYNCLRNVYLKNIHKLLNYKKLKLVYEKKLAFDAQIYNLSDNVYLHGYWQNYNYFKNIESNIRNEFTFKTLISNESLNLLNEIKSNKSICLHVRRTDFVTNKAHGILDLNYYLEAEKHILKNITNPIIYVFSDDIDWCKANIKLKSKSVFVDSQLANKNTRDHLELMINCKHFIIPNSSFAWWAAFLCTHNNKIVIAPKIWIHKPLSLTKQMSPENWTII